MAVEPSSKAKLVSARDLSKVVDEAVKAASQRSPSGAASGGSNLAAAGHNVILNPEILGRILRDAAHAQEFASSVSRGLEKAGFSVQPVSFEIGKGIHIAGFVERDRLLQREI